MFKFKMLTKVLVAVFFFGQVIELNLNLCIALSIDLGWPGSTVKLHKTWEPGSDGALDNGIEAAGLANNQAMTRGSGQLTSASRVSASTTRREISTNVATNTIAAGSSTEETTPGAPREAASTSGEGEEAAWNITQTLESNGRFNYFGRVLIGEQQRPFLLLFDLTSSAFWVPSSDCKSDRCISRSKYNRSESATSQSEERELDPAFWNHRGSIRVAARPVRDRVTFAGITIEDQSFGEVTELEGEPLSRMPFDGFMGLGFTSRLAEPSTWYGTNHSAAEPALKTPFERIYGMGLLMEPIFSLLIKKEIDQYGYSADNGELVLGQLATGYTAQDLTYVPVTHVDYWEFHLEGVALRQHIGAHELEHGCESACPAILDTSNSYISGHRSDIDRLNRALGALPVGNGLYRLSGCNLRLMPDLILTIGGVDFNLAPEDYVIVHRIRDSVVSCHSALRVVEAEEYPFWVLGERFLRRHYVVFDYGRRRIGFAKSKSLGLDTEVDFYGQPRRKERFLSGPI